MNKKGLIFSISLIFIAVGAFVLLFTAINKLEKLTDPVRTIGERALEILQANTETEKILFYVDESAKISAEKAYARFVDNAGTFDLECGTIENSGQKYVYWNNAQKKCFETDFYNNYQMHFNGQLNKYLRSLNKNIPLSNYDLFVKDREQISGIAIQPIQLNIMPPGETAGITDTAATGIYTIKPSFTIQFKKDFSSLNTLKQFTKSVLDDDRGCKNLAKTEALACVQNFVKQYEINIKEVKIPNKNTFLLDVQGDLPTKIALFIPTKEETPPETTPTA